MFDFISKLYSPPAADVIAKSELAHYERSLLAAQAKAAYETKMVEYYAEGIKRLAGFKLTTARG